MKPKAPTNSRPWHGLLHPSSVIVFVVFAALTLLVWWKQVEHQRTLLSRHTHDVCAQAAQRLHARVDSRMRAANVFARRWSTHGSDFSERRFTAFATVLRSELPSFHSVRLVQPSRERDWLVPAGVDTDWLLLGDQRQPLLQEARTSARGVLSAPVQRRQGGTSFFAALRLNRQGRDLGYLVVEFRSEAMIRAVFQRRIREEFLTTVSDGSAPLFQYPQGTVAGSAEAELTATQRLTLSNRAWTVTISPRREQVAFSSWSASRWVPLLGLFLTLGVSLLVHLLTRRIALYRAAHHLARCSETRYRSIFNSTTDGLLIIDPDDQIIEANPAAESMHGYAPGELGGRSYNDLIVPGNTRLYDEFKRQLQQYGTVTLDSVHLAEGGGTIDVEVRGTRLDYDNQPCALVIVTDVSDLRRAVSRHKMLSRKVLVAQEEERARVSRDLHDELGQLLTAMRLELDMLRRTECIQPCLGSIDKAVELLEEAAKELRRICKGLRPPLLDDLGLEPSVRLLVDEFQQRSHVGVDLEVQWNEGEHAVPMEVALSAYRILQEVLNNISRHAQAREVNIVLAGVDDELTLSVYDDGRGFDRKELAPGGGFGLAGMQERSSLVGGTLDIRSEPFQGTRVLFRVPLEETTRKVRDDAHADCG